MKQLKTFLKAYFLTCLLLVCSLWCTPGYATPSYIALDTGYRYDRISFEDESPDPRLILAYVSGEFQEKDLQSYQLGFRGLWKPGCFCSNFLLKGAAHYGWIRNGKALFTAAERARADRGHTVDANLGLGYSFCASNCFEFVPLVGLSYDKQHVRIDQVFDALGPAPDPTIVKVDTSWYGPWAGFDFYFDTCNFCLPLCFDAGYEFHYGWARFRRHDSDGVNRKLQMPEMKGHVFHFGTAYQINCNWLLGVRFQFTYWNSAHKREINREPTAAPRINRNIDLRWESFAATVNLGRSF